MSMGEKDPEGGAIHWTSHPLRENWARSTGLCLFLILVWVAVYLLYKDITLLIIAIVFLLVSLSPYWLPTRYALSEEGVAVATLFGTKRKKWSELRRFHADRRGIFLSPLVRPSWLDHYRGFYLPCDGDLRERVLDFVQNHAKTT